MILFATGNYLNAAYRSLIREDDPYILEQFNKMANCMNHSKICLLNIVFYVIMSIHPNFDRSKFDTSSYEAYMEGVNQQLDSMLLGATGALMQSVSHQCNGMDIKTCDPNDDMFKFAPPPEEGGTE